MTTGPAQTAAKVTQAQIELDTTEQALIQRAREGEEAAWGTLVHAYQEQAFRLAYLMLRNADDAADVAQETFIRAFLALDSFDPSRPLRPWLLSIVANQARNKKRSLGRYWQAMRRYLESRSAEDLVTPPAGTGLDERQQARTLWQAVQKLNNQGQEIIYLRYFLSLSEAETAEVLQIARGTVKSRTSRALNKLRRVIDHHYPDLPFARD